MPISLEELCSKKENHQDDVYYRMGDKSQKLDFNERLQLLYAKGGRYYENEPVYGSSLNDIDLDFVQAYCEKIGYTKGAEEYLRQNGNYLVTQYGREEMSVAAILLFGRDPQRFLPRARVRFIRYEGTEARVGTEMNVIKDKVFTGRILDMVRDSLDFVRSQIKERTRLGNDCRFITTPEYPEFVWKEVIINAITHRDYNIKGTDIQIKMFDDRLVVESPGILPGMVRLNNMRTVHFSRNPRIAVFLHQYDYVQEFGEGVDRMCREMTYAGLPAPEYETVAFMLHATIRNRIFNKPYDELNDELNDKLNVELKYTIHSHKGLSPSEEKIYHAILNTPFISRKELCSTLNISGSTVDRAIRALISSGKLKRVGSKKTGHWQAIT